VGEDNGGGGLAGHLKVWLGVGAAVVALVVALIGLDQDWFERGKSRQCQMEGTVGTSFSGSPAAAVRLGFAPSDGSSDFVQLTRSGADGTFSSSCEAARGGTSGSSFALLAKGTFRGTALPCLGPPEHTGRFVDREGETKGISVEVQGC
jgi:hypothetical protein